MCAGLLGGVGLPFFKELGTELLVLLILIFATASAGVFFIRETKKEEALKNMYPEIIPERVYSPSIYDDPDVINSSRKLKSPDRSDIEANQVSNHRQAEASQMFEHILNELGGIGREDNSKLGTLFGSPRAIKAKLNADFNARQFENPDKDYKNYDGAAESSSSSSSDQEQSDQGVEEQKDSLEEDFDDYEEDNVQMEENFDYSHTGNTVATNRFNNAGFQHTDYQSYS
jgi:hypothetical protein